MENLGLGVEKDLYVTIPRGSYDKLKARVQIRDSVMAPVSQGQKLGTITLEHDGEVIKEVPLVALRSVREGGFFHNIVDSMLMIFE